MNIGSPIPIEPGWDANIKLGPYKLLVASPHTPHNASKKLHRVTFVPDIYESTFTFVADEVCSGYTNSTRTRCESLRGFPIHPTEYETNQTTNASSSYLAEKAYWRRIFEPSLRLNRSIGIMDVSDGTSGNWLVERQWVKITSERDPLVSTMGLGVNRLGDGYSHLGPSFIQNLVYKLGVPSLSWSHTASYQNEPAINGSDYTMKYTTPGSLVFGGYDKQRCDFSKTKAPKFHFNMNSTSMNDYFRVSNFSIGLDLGSKDEVRYVPPGKEAIIDNNSIFIWLPKDICDKFASILGLSYDAKNRAYHIDDIPLSNIPNSTIIEHSFGFGMGSNINSRQPGSDYLELNKKAITMVKTVDPSTNSNLKHRRNTRYSLNFPIRPIPPEMDQIPILGDPFFHFACMLTDYEEMAFSITKAAAHWNATRQIIPINHNFDKSTTIIEHKLPKTAVISMSVLGSIMAVLFICVLPLWYRSRQKRRRTEAYKEKEIEVRKQKELKLKEDQHYMIGKSELEGQNSSLRNSIVLHETSGSPILEVEGAQVLEKEGNTLFELEATSLAELEAVAINRDSKWLVEKIERV